MLPSDKASLTFVADGILPCDSDLLSKVLLVVLFNFSLVFFEKLSFWGLTVLRTPPIRFQRAFRSAVIF
jgi:hypothetical protein